MGFLKFLKREKKESFDELDLPPAPPPLEGFEEGMELPDFPELDEKISAPAEEPDFNFSEKEEEAIAEMQPEFPKLPEIPETEETNDMPPFPETEEKPTAPVQPMRIPSIPEPMARITQPVPAPEDKPGFTQDAYPNITGRLFAHEKRVLHERPTAKTIYVRVDKFKATLGSINMVRSDLRRSEEALAKLENIKGSKDRAFDRVRASLDDLQKKLIFIDKTLFKGD